MVSDDLRSFVLVADQTNGGQRWNPSFDFVTPVGQGGLWHDDQMRSVNVFVVLHVAE